ncbi:MAG: DUF2191 domain-containing protein [Candidatus Xenobia bacterium]
MRTTLTLEDDVVVLLQKVQRRKHLKFKDVVNQALRSGLLQMERKAEQGRRKFRTTGLDSGPCLLGTLDNIGEVLSILEGDRWR